MATIKVENSADSSWQTTIEQRAYLMLSSLSASVSIINLDFSELPADGAMTRRYRCTVSSPNLAAGKCQVSVEHPDGYEAIEGALHRFRRIVAHTRQIGRLSNYQNGSMRRTG